MSCVLTAWTGRALPNPGRALQLKAPAGRSNSPARLASAFGNGFGRQSKSLIEIRRNPIAFGSSTPAERALRLLGPRDRMKSSKYTVRRSFVAQGSSADGLADAEQIAFAVAEPGAPLADA